MSEHTQGNEYDDADRLAYQSPALRAEWLAAIIESIDTLQELNVKTEDGFLSVGSQLRLSRRMSLSLIVRR